MKHLLLTLVTVPLLALLASCQSQGEPASGSGFQDLEKINVLVTVLPQTEFVKAVGGDQVEVLAMVREGFNPETYEPTPEQLKAVTDADIYFQVGPLPFETQYLNQILSINPSLRVINTSEGIALRPLEDHEDEETNSALPDNDQDPHIWLSPRLAIIQVNHITQALSDFQPQSRDYFIENQNQYTARLQALDTQLASTFAPFQGQTFLVYHSAFGYLADDYGLTQLYIELEGKEPTVSGLQSVIAAAKANSVKVVFVQKQFSTQAATAIADEINGAVVQLDPLSPDYLENMSQIAQTIQSSLR